MKTKAKIGYLLIILFLSAHNTLVCCEIDNSYANFWIYLLGWFGGILGVIGAWMLIMWCLDEDVRKSL